MRAGAVAARVLDGRAFGSCRGAAEGSVVGRVARRREGREVVGDGEVAENAMDGLGAIDVGDDAQAAAAAVAWARGQDVDVVDAQEALGPGEIRGSPVDGASCETGRGSPSQGLGAESVWGTTFARRRAAGARQPFGIYPDGPPPPCVLGYEVSGTVDKLGLGVEGFAVGDRALAMTMFGGYAELACTLAAAARRIPDGMTDEDGRMIVFGWDNGANRDDVWALPFVSCM